MRHHPVVTGITIVAVCAVVVADALYASDNLAPPARFTATVMIIDSQAPGSVQIIGGGDAPGIGSNNTWAISVAPGTVMKGQPNHVKEKAALLAIAVDRWSNEDETAALVKAFKSGGTSGLVSQMEKTRLGALQVNGDLRWPIRWASTWNSGSSRVVRLATTGTFLFPDSASRARSTDNLVDIIEFTMPPGGAGEGWIVAAIRVNLDEQGRVVPITHAIDTGIERMTNVKIETRTSGNEER